MSRFAALAPFQTRSFRFQWPADLLTSWAFEMEGIILGWYILVETGSVLLLTLFASLLYLGTLVAPLFGVSGDRIGQRNLLFGMRTIYMILAATLMTLAFTGILSPFYVFIIATPFLRAQWSRRMKASSPSRSRWRGVPFSSS